MLRILILTVTVFATTFPFYARGSEIINLGPPKTGIVLNHNEDGAARISVTVSEVLLRAVEIDGQLWASPQVPEGSNLMQRGLPSLPFLETQYLLNRKDGIDLHLASLVTTKINLGDYGFVGIAPSKGHFDRSIDPDTVPWVFDTEVYSGRKTFPNQDVWVAAPAISGPWRTQTLRVPAATWDATTNTLTVIEEATFEIVKINDAPNPRTGLDRKPTGLFGGMQLAVNAPSGRNVGPLQAGRLLILSFDDFIDEIQPLADWESLVGYPTILTALSAVPHSGAVPTAGEIHTYIQSLYDAPGSLAWIILVGDYQQIPNRSGVNPDAAPCDPCYTKLEGADNRPDAAISRISAQNGADVTTQVDKILHYEQQPDTGSAATWYQKAFGIGGDDAGGGYDDWERIDLLRNDLLQPAYSYSEFDQLYHSPSKAQVKASVESGTSLGFYIGHGAELSWVTSGFSVTDVHSLINGEMLPVIWDVACVNGAFHNYNECFAESWLRREGGGAVSFEAATTNESWVPPCDAQRGVADAIRLETDFTTGAQHVAGKIACMNINGDSNSSEGTMFMEQSTLFGSAVLWPRTLEPSAVDMPDDFSVSDGAATLTVRVGGAALAKSGAAIVNFYTTNRGTITPVGSGLIDANGIVNAAVSEEPTHCHIHGHNLLPQAFELAAQDDARVNLNHSAYACSSAVSIRVADANVPGSTALTIDALNVEVSAGGSPLVLVLTETGTDTGFYEGAFDLGADLIVAHGDTLVVTYEDADTGSGTASKSATATIDCMPPAITSVTSTTDHESLTISFTTTEPGTTEVRWGATIPPATLISSDSLIAGTHTATIEGLDPCQRIFFEVGSTDAVNNVARDNNGGSFYVADTMGWHVFFEETMDSDPQWTVDNGSFSAAQGWAFGQPTGEGQDIYGNDDPLSGYTGNNVYGINLSGDSPANATTNELTLTTGSIDLSEATAIQLSYWRWLGVEGDTYDNARIRMSVDQGAWVLLWENDSATIDESAWTKHALDISAAAGHQDVRIQWTYGASDSLWNYAGWNIDDVRIEGPVTCGAIGSLFADDFESGACSRWSSEVNGQ